MMTSRWWNGKSGVGYPTWPPPLLFSTHSRTTPSPHGAGMMLDSSGFKVQRACDARVKIDERKLVIDNAKAYLCFVFASVISYGHIVVSVQQRRNSILQKGCISHITRAWMVQCTNIVSRAIGFVCTSGNVLGRYNVLALTKTRVVKRSYFMIRRCCTDTICAMIMYFLQRIP